ncbi:MAG: glycoside hydrolase family 3 N-terminal domain-containing protein [Bacteroidales bacterium]
MEHGSLKRMLVSLVMVPALVCITLSCGHEKKDRVESLLAEMTLEEKIGQMMQICFSTITTDGTKELDLDLEKAREAILEMHTGSFISATGRAEDWIDFVHRLQKIAIEETRLGIPLLIGIDHVHGANYVDQATFLPHNITLSCSFDPELASLAARITALEMADLGLNWNLAPVLDVGKNPYWPRFYETFGEDPLLCEVMGTSYIRSLIHCEGIDPYRLAGCAKHFIGYSDPRSGWDRTPALIPSQELCEIFIPPFREAVNAGVQSVMLNSGEVNGVPVHVSQWLQQDILREQLGFEGVILTDIKDIRKVVEMHAAAADRKEATLMALNAGIDMSMSCDSYEFSDIVRELVGEKKVSAKRIDESVRRILRLKEDLGLFDHPYPRSDRMERIGSQEHHRMAVSLAGQSMVLLKNDGVLPLEPGNKNILLAGFAANSRRMLNGAWTLEWLGAEEERQPAGMPTLYGALRETYGQDRIIHLDSSILSGPAGRSVFFRQAGRCDVILLTLGEEPYSEFKGNISDLTLPSSQLRLARWAISTGKPVVLLLIEGRPRLLGDLSGQADAIIFAGLPGSGGAEALAGILSGKENPSGRLSFSYPRSPGHHTPYYHKASDESLALYPFGHGLSYSLFEHGPLTASDTLIDGDSPFRITVTVKNKGDRTGSQAVLLFMRDEVGRITRPVRELVAFEKISLEPGQTQEVVFEISPERDLAYPDGQGNMILEDGTFYFFSGNEQCTVRLRQGY